MHIVILDAQIFGVDNDAWRPFDSCGTVTVNEHTSLEQVVDQCKGADVVCSCSIVYNASLLSRMRHVKLLCLLSSGYDKVDMNAATENGIAVCAIPDYSTIAVAEYLFALMLHHYRAVAQHAQAVSSGKWYASQTVSYWECEHQELYGKQLGIIGYGNTGEAVHTRAVAFGMKCAIFTRNQNRLVQHHGDNASTMSQRNNHSNSIQGADSVVVDLPTLLKTSDFVSLHVPLNDETRHMLGSNELALMKPNAILLNVARGGLIDEAALYNSLKDNTIAAAILDVTQQEPLPSTHPLVSLDNCIITPHVAWATVTARTRLLSEGAQAIQSFQSGDNHYRVG